MLGGLGEVDEASCNLKMEWVGAIQLVVLVSGVVGECRRGEHRPLHHNHSQQP